MKKKVLYTYLGTNGTLTTPIHLEDIYYVRSYYLEADSGYMLTKDGKELVSAVSATENDIDEWKEVVAPAKVNYNK